MGYGTETEDISKISYEFRCSKYFGSPATGAVTAAFSFTPLWDGEPQDEATLDGLVQNMVDALVQSFDTVSAVKNTGKYQEITANP